VDKNIFYTAEIQPEVKKKLAFIQLLVTDCDGVLTDGRIYYGSNGGEYKAFFARDGKGLKMVQDEGIICAIITGRDSPMVDHRARELGITEVYQGISDKSVVLNKLMEKYDLEPKETAYIGDDINDLGALRACGLSAAVGDAVSKVKAEVDYVTRRRGGRGAVRELIDLLLKFRKESR